MIKKHSFLAIALLFIFIIESFASGGTNMQYKLKEINKSGAWKGIWSDGYEIYLCILPFYKQGAKLFEVEDRKFMRIGNRELSPDANKIVFTLETYENVNYQDLNRTELYLMDTDGTNVATLPTGSFENIFLMGFLGNDKLLFESSEKENYVTKPGTSVIYVIDLNTNKIDKFVNQEIPVNNLNASSKGDLLIYSKHRKIIVYNVEKNTIAKLNIDMDMPILSPDGKKILFRGGDMMGSYSIVNIDGSGEKLILPKEKIASLLRGSGDYRDFHFTSWSPDGRYILFGESSDFQKGRQFVIDLDIEEISEMRK